MTRSPVLFIGHGSPMNALADNAFTRTLRSLGESLPRPKAVLVLSAHWYGDGVKVQASSRPGTIHDFGGFPQELFDVQYPAPGGPALAAAARDLLAPAGAVLTEEWGLDHGAWSVLRHLFPKADVPAVQVSLDQARPFPAHHDLGRRLKPLRDQGVLILGSGGIVHNLGRLGRPGGPVPTWASAFDIAVRDALRSGDRDALIAPHRMPGADLSVPTPDHYLPLLYALGAADEGEEVSFPFEGFEFSSLSLRAARWG